MIYIDTKSTDVFYNFGCEYYFATEKHLSDDIFLMWATEPTLMIGKYQNTMGEIDSAYAREKNITVVRRMSGGGTIYTDLGGWQFSVITPSSGLGIEFGRFVYPVVDALCSLGLNAAATGRNDITVDGKKVSGNAQFRLSGTTVHHGSLLFDTDIHELVCATTPKDYKITSKSIKSVRDRVTNIRDHLAHDMTHEEFRQLIVSRLTNSTYTISNNDGERIRAISCEKFNDPKIIYASSPKFDIEKTVHTDGGTFTLGFTVKKGMICDSRITGDFFTAEDISGALVGVQFTPGDVSAALSEFDGVIFGATTDELVRAIFE